MKTSPILAIVLFLGGTGLLADEPMGWSRFRGPNGSGIADDQRPPVEIGPDRHVKWKVPVPAGLSSPVIAGDLVVITAFDSDKLFTIAYQRTDGREAWRKEASATKIEKFLPGEGSPAASTCATDGQRIVSYFGSCGLFCHDLTGNEVWRHELPPVNLAGNFGSGTSPILTDGQVVLVRDQIRDAEILVLDADSGRPNWEAHRDSPVSYSTPLVWSTPQGKQVIVAGHARMIGYDLANGSEQWTVAGLPSGCCTSPVAADGIVYFAGWSPGGAGDSEIQMPAFDGLLKNLDKNKDGMLSREEAEKTFGGFFDSQDANADGQISSSEYEEVLKFMAAGENRAFALKAGGQGDQSANLLWTHTKGLPYVPTAILYRGQYVMVKDGGIVTALDAATGKQIYMKRAVGAGKYYASPVAANGLIYFTTLEDGTVTVLKAGTAQPEVVAKNPPLGERVSATPAIADDTLYVRTAGNLYAFTNTP